MRSELAVVIVAVVLGAVCQVSARGVDAATAEELVPARSVAETSFSRPEWRQNHLNFTGHRAAWAWSQADGVQFVQNTAGQGRMLAYAIEASSGAVTAEVGYAWRAGRETGRAAVSLEDDEHHLVLHISQGGEGPRYHLFTRVGGEEQDVAHFVIDDAPDVGHAEGGGLPAATVELYFDPVTGEAAVTRGERLLGRFETPLRFQPDVLRLVDRSQGDEQFRLTHLRVWRGARDPQTRFAGFQTPYGAMFVEGSDPEVTLRFAFHDDAGDEPRPVRLRARLVDHEGVYLGDVAADGSVRSNEPWRPDLTPDDRPLEPGLYWLEGSVQTGRFAAELSERFAVVPRELHDRPRDQIPEWVGLVPYPEALPDDMAVETLRIAEFLGVRHLRFRPGWGRVQSDLDTYDWSYYDTFVEEAVAREMNLLGYVSYWTPWADRYMPDQAYTPEGRQFWVDQYARPAMQRYGEHVKIWQVWNEPDAFWNEDPRQASGFAMGFGSPQNYYDLFLRTRAAALDLDMDLKVMASLASGRHEQEIRRLFGYGLGDHFDGIVVHTYGAHHQHFVKLRELLTELGHPTAPIATGETGIPDPDPGRTPRVRQANRVVEVLLSSAGVDHVFGVDWFVLHDHVAAGQYGLLDRNGQAHGSAVAYHNVARLLAGAQSGHSETRDGLRIHRIERQGYPPLVAVLNLGGGSRRLTIKNNALDDPSPLVWTLFGRQVEPQWLGDRTTLDFRDNYLLMEGDVEIDDSMSLALVPGSLGTVRVRIDARVDEPQMARLDIKLAAQELHQQELRVEPGSTEVEVNIPDPRPGQAYDLDVSLTWDQGTIGERRDIEFFPAFRVGEDVARQLHAPDGLPRFFLGEEHFVPNQDTYYGGEHDLSAWLLFGWTEDHLVVWTEVRDDVFVPIGRETPWVQDGLQIAIDPKNEKTPESSFIEIQYGLSEEGPLAFVIGDDTFEADVAAERRGDRTFHRLSIPWSQLGIDPQPGLVIGLTQVINDNDGATRKGWLTFGQGVAEEKNPARFREIVLDDRQP